VVQHPLDIVSPGGLPGLQAVQGELSHLVGGLGCADPADPALDLPAHHHGDQGQGHRQHKPLVVVSVLPWRCGYVREESPPIRLTRPGATPPTTASPPKDSRKRLFANSTSSARGGICTGTAADILKSSLS